jgi:hypothetical protein
MPAVCVPIQTQRHRDTFAPPVQTSTDALERAAGFGQWWHDPQTGRSLLSPTAADYLEMPGRPADSLDDRRSGRWTSASSAWPAACAGCA